MAKKRRSEDPIETTAKVVATVDDVIPPTPSNRVRASQLRAKIRLGAILSPEDTAWLADYDNDRAKTADSKAAASIGASRARKVSYTEEEAESMGTGAAAETAAAAAMSREEGRRYDSLISVGITALRQAVDTYAKMCNHMMDRNAQLETSHVAMMDAIRENYLARVSAEGETERALKAAEDAETAGEKDGIGQLAEQLLPHLLQSLGGGGGATVPLSRSRKVPA